MAKTNKCAFLSDDAAACSEIKRFCRLTPFFLLLTGLMLLFALPVFGQTAPLETTHETKKTFVQIWQEGGVVMYLLALASIFTLALTAEGFFLLRLRRLAPAILLNQAKELFLQNRYQELTDICRQNPSYFSKLILTALGKMEQGRDAMDHAIQITALRQATLYKSRITYLSVIGVVTPMIGLTGTVVGMIKAFAVLGSSGIADPTALSARIAEVLTATAGGLIVAIPAFIFFYILKNRLIALLTLVDTLVSDLLDLIPSHPH